MNNRGLLVVVSGPSGVGKGTIMAEFFKKSRKVKYSVSMTTRAPRPGETDGKDYYFVTREYFEKLVAEGGVLEYTEYNGNYYGSPKGEIMASLEEGWDVILEIEIKGAQQIKARFPDALLIFVMPPSFGELHKRLAGRNTETSEQITKRLMTARQEIALAADYDYILVNDTVETAAQKLDEIIRTSKCSKKYMKEIIKEVLENA